MNFEGFQLQRKRLDYGCQGSSVIILFNMCQVPRIFSLPHKSFYSMKSLES